MEKMNNLRDLLKHEIQDLYSAEEQILDALPAMIDKAGNPTLKSSLKEHLRITELQKNRLDKVLQLMEVSKEEVNGNKKKGILGLFSGKQKCKGMEGIIEEAKKVMGEDMHPDVMDAAIIASAQKVEHYEICGYGTARSFAAELGLSQVADLLEETLDEEYEADDKLTFLAESRVNKEAEKGTTNRTGSTSSRSAAGRETSQDTVRRREMEMEPVSDRQSGQGRSSNNASGKSTAPKGTTSRTSTGRTTASKKSTSSKTASKNSGSGSARGSNGGTRSRGR